MKKNSFIKFLSLMLAVVLTVSSTDLSVFADQVQDITEITSEDEMAADSDVYTLPEEITTENGNSIPKEAYEAEESDVTIIDSEENAVDPNLESGVTSDMEITGDNSFAQMINEAVEENEKKYAENPGFGIHAVEIKDSIAEVNYETLIPATIVVSVFDETTGKMAGSAKSYASHEEHDIRIPLEFTLPEYYYVRTNIIDEDTLEPYCREYETDLYTKKMQDFLAKTVYDFDEEDVVNLDSDKTNNFIVAGDNTVMAEYNSTTKTANILKERNDETKTYVIEKADTAIENLKAGQSFVLNTITKNDVTGADELTDMLIVKVKSIEKTVESDSSVTVTITGGEAKIEEVFPFIKIEIDEENGAMRYDTSKSDPDVTLEEEELLGVWEDTVPIGGGFTLPFDIGSTGLSGKIGVNVTGQLKFYLDIWDLVSTFVEVKIGISVKGTVSAKVSLIDKDFELCYIEIVIPACPLLGIGFTPSFFVEAEGKFTMGVEFDAECGFRASVEYGGQKWSSVSAKPIIEVEATIYFGIRLTPDFHIISKDVASVGIEASLGAEVSGKIDLAHTDKTHLCNMCIDGSVKAKLQFEVVATIFFHDVDFPSSPSVNLNLGDFETSIERGKLTISYEITKFYYSFDLPADTAFGWGKCPNKASETKYTITINAQKGSVTVPYPDAKVQMTQLATLKTLTPNSKGVVGGELTAGKWKMHVYDPKGCYEDYDETVTFESGKPFIKTITLKEAEMVITDIGTSYSASVNSDMNVALSKKNQIYMWGQGYRLPDGSLLNSVSTPKGISIVKDGKELQFTSVSCGENGIGAITNTGDLYIWGNYDIKSSSSGGTVTRNMTKIHKVNTGGKKVKKFVQSKDQYAYLTTDGQLYIAGVKFEGLTDVTRENYSGFTRLISGEFVKDVFLSEKSACAVTASGSTYLWGDLNGFKTYEILKEPTKYEIGEAIVDYSSDSRVNGYVTESGKLIIWGNNSKGQMGDGTTVTKSTRSTVSLGGDIIKRVNICNEAVSAVTQSGTLYTWGSASNKQLGYGSDSYSPKAVNVGGNVVTNVKLGSDHGVALTKGGKVYRWGKSASNATGITTPTLVNIKYAKNYTYQLDKNDNLVGPVVQYSASDEAFEEALLEEADEEVINQADIKDENASAGIAEFSGLEKDTIYNVYEFSDRNAEDVLSNANLLYIGQGISDAEGKLKHTYTAKDSFSDSVVIAVKLKTEVVTEKPNPDKPDPVRPAPVGDILPGDMPFDGIVPEGLWIAGVDEAGYDYIGTQIKPDVRVYDGTTLLQDKVDYTIKYLNNVKAYEKSLGTQGFDSTKAPAVSVVGKGNYTGTDTAYFKINRININSDDVSIPDISVLSTGKVLHPVPDVLFNGKKLKNITDFSLEYPDNGTNSYKSAEDAGWKIIVKGQGNFSGTKEIKLYICDRTKITLMNKVTVGKIANQQYTGKPIEVSKFFNDNSILVKNGSTNILNLNEHFTARIENGVEVGKATLVLTGIREKGYAGTKKISFNILPLGVISKAEIAGLPASPYIYNGQMQKPELSLKYKKADGTYQPLEVNKDYEIKETSADYVNAGSKTILIKGINGYTGQVKKTYKINAYDLSTDVSDVEISISANAVEFAKGGARPVPTVKFKGETVPASGYKLSYKRNNAVNDATVAGTAPTVTVTGKGNLKGSKSISFKIIEQDLSNLAVNAPDMLFVNKAGKAKSVPQVTDLNGKKLANNKDYTVSAEDYRYANTTKLSDAVTRNAGDIVSPEDIVPAGTVIKVTVKAKEGSGYKGSSDCTYRVTEKSIAKATVVVKPQTYTGKEVKPTYEDITSIMVSGSPLNPVDGSGVGDYEIIGYSNNINKGTAKLVIAGRGNYGGTKTVSFKITSKFFSWF